MDLVPLRVIRVLHERTRDCHVCPDQRNAGAVDEVLAGRLCIRLRHREVADDLEDKIAAFLGSVAGVQEARELRVYLEPAVRIPVCFVPDAIRFTPCGRVDDGARYGDALLLHEQSIRMIDVLP